eukprot:TRINITY_DN16859_c0_g1_i1.p1 TRINITY_DN16859_c0_g1~~TRINITY_DN16859_c0_g1_i1.p1  ORF type:complete len:199 (-),score=32.96 TRINITY_DN16859_c0_g1_i1:312-908(-)
MDDLITAIERSLGEVHMLERTVQGYKDESQQLLLTRLNDLVSHLATIQSVADKCNDVQIPVEVVRFVDEGRNPDQFTQAFLKGCVERNEMTKGRVEAFKSLREHLIDEIDEAFPEEMDEFRALRIASFEATTSIESAKNAPPEEPTSGAALTNGVDAKMEAQPTVDIKTEASPMVETLRNEDGCVDMACEMIVKTEVQ